MYVRTYVVRNKVKIGCLDIESFFDLFWSVGVIDECEKKSLWCEIYGGVGGRLEIGCVRKKELCVCENVCSKKCKKSG